MPLNLLTLTRVDDKGPIEVNPTLIESVEGTNKGTHVMMCSGKEYYVTDPVDRIRSKVNARPPDGF